MLAIVTRTLVIALTLWAFLPAVVCRAYCVNMPPPNGEMACHAGSDDLAGDHEAEACPKCAASAALLSSLASDDFPLGTVEFRAVAVSALAAKGAERIASTPRSPPDLVNSVYLRANPPLLN